MNYTGIYEVQYTMAPNPDHSTPSLDWYFVSSVELTSMKRHVFRLEIPVWATAVRLIVPYETSVVDELEVFGYAASIDFEDPRWMFSDVKYDAPTRSIGKLGTTLNASWTVGFEVFVDSQGSDYTAIAFGGIEDVCSGISRVYLASLGEGMKVCAASSTGTSICTGSVIEVSRSHRVRVLRNMTTNTLSIFVDGNQKVSQEIDFVVSAESDTVSVMSACHDHDQSVLSGHVSSIFFANPAVLEASVEAWVTDAGTGCLGVDKFDTIDGMSISQCRRICVEDYGGCNDGFAYQTSSDSCHIPKDGSGCAPGPMDGSIYETAVRGNGRDLTVSGYERSQDEHSASGAGWLSLSYAGVTASGCKAKCDATPKCGIFIFRRPSTQSHSSDNCWLYEDSDFARMQMEPKAGFNVYRRTETNVCLPEPMFADVAMCDAFGRFDGVPTVRDRQTGAYAAVFSAEGSPEDRFTEEAICGAMGMSFEQGVSHTSSQQHMRYVWYPIGMASYCDVEVGVVNNHGATVIEKDMVNHMCLTRYDASTRLAEKFFDRLQCSCGTDQLSHAHVNSLVQTEGVTTFATPTLWASFGPRGVLSESCKLCPVSQAVSSQGVSLRSWNLPDRLGTADFDGENGFVEVLLGDSQEPVLSASDGALTITAWMNPTEARSGAGVQLKDTKGAFGSALSVDQLGKFSWMVQNEQGAYHGVSSIGPAENKWAHVVGVYEDRCLRLYVNGTLQEKSCDSVGYQTLPTDGDQARMLIGMYSSSRHTSFFKGSIGDVRVYDRVLTESEIRTVMSESLGQNAQPTK
jgi:hypothetical protein